MKHINAFILAEGATHVVRQHNCRKIAFTLAEVLITLAVIGVVAALTIPNLIQSYKKTVVETRLAKFYNVMNNAIRMAEVDYGPQSTWPDYHIDHTNDENGNAEYDKGPKIDIAVNKYFAPYLRITGSEDIIATHVRVYYLSDGSAFSFHLKENREIMFYPYGSPEKYEESSSLGSGMFAFAFIPGVMSYPGYKYNLNNGMQPNLYKWDGNEASLMNDTTYGCKNGNDGVYCTEIIRRNGWKIPKDYPRKF